MDRGHDPRPPPLMCHTTTERVSSVDLIGPCSEETSHREVEQAEAHCPGGSLALPPWLQQSGRGPTAEDRGREVGEREVWPRDPMEPAEPPWLQQRRCADDRGREEGEGGREIWPRDPMKPAAPPWLQQRGSVDDRGREEREREGEGRQPLLETVSEVSRREDTMKKCAKSEEGVKVELAREVSGEEVSCEEEEEVEECAVVDYENSFVGEVQKFVQRNSKMFDIATEKDLTIEPLPTLHNLKSEESCEL